MLPAPSIIVEWETGQEGHGDRAGACLAELNRQMWAERSAFSAPPELILVFDPDQAPRGSVEAAAAGLDWPGRFEIAEAPAGCDYYGKKNFGFRRSSGEVALFFDSDLAPEPGWLRALVEPLADPGRNVAVGRTHFETGTVYERAMALFWIFDERLEVAKVRPTRRLVSNNIAFRRRLFEALPFPDRPTYRGQCSELGAKLARLGIVMFEATAARAAHPAPAGPRAFAARAFRAGRDSCAYRRMEGAVGALDWFGEWRRDLGSVRRRIGWRAPRIGAGPAARSAAALLGALYYSIKAAGYISETARGRARSGPEPAAGPSPSGR
ncbi:MAG TPA: glycosyltransferase [Allosphingosinicella sp.]|jgi:hypothetical protein